MQILTPTNPVVHDAWMAQDLRTAEELLTKEIDADHNNHHSYVSRSVIRARHFKWDNALQDALIVRCILEFDHDAIDDR
jgi:hypothetical protein